MTDFEKLPNGFELKPIYERKKSYYKKAIIGKGFTDCLNLYSYDLKVATIDAKTKELTIPLNITKNNLTQTTLRHIKEFAKQYADKKYFNLTKKDILKIQYDFYLKVTK